MNNLYGKMDFFVWIMNYSMLSGPGYIENDISHRTQAVLTGFDVFQQKRTVRVGYELEAF